MAGKSRSKTKQPRTPKEQTATSASRTRRKSEAVARAEQRHTPGHAPLIEDSTKRDIVGVLFIIAAVALMVAAFLPEQGVVSDFLSNALRLAFGVGIYIVPFFLAAIGITFIIRFERERVPLRAAIGFGIIFIAILGLIALATPLDNGNYDIIFNRRILMTRGGYIGAALAWTGYKLLGPTITGIVLGGVIIIGILIIGFSVSFLVDLIRRKRAEREAALSSAPMKPFGRIRRASAPVAEAPVQEKLPGMDDAQLRAASEAGMTRKLGSYPSKNEESYTQVLTPDNVRYGQAASGYDDGAATAEPTYDTRRSQAITDEGYADYASGQEPYYEPDTPWASQSAEKTYYPLMTQRIDGYSDEYGYDGYDGYDDPDVYDDLYGYADPYAQPVDGYAESGAAFDTQEEYDLYGSDGAGYAAAGESYSLYEAPDGMGTYLVDNDGVATQIAVIEGQEEADAFFGTYEDELPWDEEGIHDAASTGVDEDALSADGEEEDDDFDDVPVRGKHAAKHAPQKTVAETPGPEKASSKKRTSKSAAVEKSESRFTLPSWDLLVKGDGLTAGASDSELEATSAELQATLEDFGIMAKVVGWVAGPTVTLFKVELPPGVRVSRITNLNDDIALALAAPGVRIFAPIPGTNYVGIEVPNRTRKTVYLTDVLKDAGEGPMQICIGKDVEGNSIVSDLSKMPHLLIAGTTGSGKSVEINGMIMSILMRATPDEVRFIMIDPKRVEFSGYNGIPHLYVPVVTECKEAASALSWGVAEMERRLKLFSKVGVRNITSFNEKARAAAAAVAEAEARGEEPPENEYGDPVPYIVIVIDELADLMMNVGKEVEASISRIAQLARAAGIHLIIATQRPSTNVVTGLIKANITCRIGLTVASGIDSRVILDSTGAENLCGYGDLLISKPEYAKPVRVQGPFVSDDEINGVVEFLKSQGEPEYHSEILQTNVVTLGDSSPSGSGGSDSDDPLVWEAADIVVSSGLGSTSNIQRRLKVGYARAGRIMDQLEEKGVVGPANGSRPREVLVDAMELETLKAFESNDG